MILRNTGLAKGKVKILNLDRVEFQLLDELVGKIPRKIILRDKAADKNWQFFKGTSLRAQTPSILMFRKSSKVNWKPVMSEEKLRNKKEMHSQ